MKKRRYDSLSEINVTNLVDVTLVLLIIFMITAPLLQKGIRINLPKAQAENIKKRDPVTVTLDKEGTLYLNQDVVEDTEFDDALLRAWELNGKPAVILRADTEMAYGRVIRLMDRIKNAGITNLGLIVQPGDEE